MKIAKRIFRGGLLSDIPKNGTGFDHTQKDLINIEIVIVGDRFYWLCTYQDLNIDIHIKKPEIIINTNSGGYDNIFDDLD